MGVFVSRRSGCLTAAFLAALLGLLALGTGRAAAGNSSWMDQPVLPRISGKVKERLVTTVRIGKAQGLRANVFAKVGDSNTEMPPFLYGLACNEPVPALPESLRKTLVDYRKVKLPNPKAWPGCKPWNSFSRRSVAAESGSYSGYGSTLVKDLPVGIPGWDRPDACRLQETPASCEIRIIRPRYAVVMTGINDFGLDKAFGITPGSQISQRISRVVTIIRAAGVVPILSSIPPITGGEVMSQQTRDDFVARTNAGIWSVARREHLPFVNLWRALMQPSMINDGLASDGVHLSVFKGGGYPFVAGFGPTTFADSTVFTSQGLRYGANLRNLITLKILARLDRVLAVSATNRPGNGLGYVAI